MYLLKTKVIFLLHVVILRGIKETPKNISRNENLSIKTYRQFNHTNEIKYLFKKVT